MITGLHRRYKEAKAEGSQLIDSATAWQKCQECLRTADPLLAFAAWYTTWLNGNMAFAQMYAVKETKLGMGMTLFELKPFRVQLFLFRSEVLIPDHRHPDVESYEVYVAGDMELTKNGVPQTVREAVIAQFNGVCLSNGGMIRIPANSIHGGWINSICSGGAFLSIQYWLKNFSDGSVANNWSAPDGTTHG